MFFLKDNPAAGQMIMIIEQRKNTSISQLGVKYFKDEEKKLKANGYSIIEKKLQR